VQALVELQKHEDPEVNMRLPKTPWGSRYLSSTEYTTRVTFTQPANGNDETGTPLPETAIATTWANVTLWRGKQEDKTETTVSVAAYKIIIRYPRTWSVDSGMNILVRGQLHNIDAFADLDGTRTELHIFTSTYGDKVN
jgi:SPP1 family predicted phage head-tail adaptor